MIKYVILIPSFNDWDCLNLLIPKIDKVLHSLKEEVSILIVNDGSTEKENLSFKNLSFLKKIEVLNLKKNVKAQIAITTGLSFLKKKKFTGGIIVMDADGQDNPEQIIDIIEESKKKPNRTITINRTTRKEEFIFKALYQIYLYMTFLFTFRYMRFGVYSYIHSDCLERILSTKDSQMAYAASLEKHFNDKKIIYASRGLRIHGESKNNYKSLIIYALKIISVLRYKVLINSLSLILIFFLFFNSKIFLLISAPIIFFNIIFFLIPHTIKTFDEENIILNIKDVKNLNY